MTNSGQAAARSKPHSHRVDAVAVVQKLREAGYEAYFAGGCVRDELLGLHPQDYDVATSAPPMTVREIFPRTQAVGAAFGVILVRQRSSMIEVATFRTEFDYADGRRPSVVRFATAEEDAQRRDFTINGLFYDPIAKKVIDFVGGQADLGGRTLRAIGRAEERFNEDHLRLLRAVRFAARFGFAIEKNTAQAIRKHAPLLKRISPERIAEELRQMLTVSTRKEAWKLLWDFALIDTICRMLPPADGVDYDPGRCVFAALPEEETIPFGLALGAMCLSYRCQVMPKGTDIRGMLDHTQVLGLVRAMRQTLRISNEEADEMQGALEGTRLMLEEKPPRLARYKRLLAMPTAGSTLLLLAAMARLGLQRERIEAVLPRLKELQGTVVAPVPLISGDDLKTLGISPGPAYRCILEQVYDAQLEEQLSDKQAAMEMARGLIPGAK